jgi:hemerythrin-like domain-containing protein
MRAEHQAVLERLETAEACAVRISADGGAAPADIESIRSFARHLESQFATHMRNEDEAIYPLLEASVPGTRHSLAPLRGEHAELRQMLAGLSRTLDEPAAAARNEQIAIQIQDLADLLRIHIRKEEAVVFAVAERLMHPSDLATLGRRLAALSKTPTPTPWRAPRASKG